MHFLNIFCSFIDYFLCFINDLLWMVSRIFFIQATTTVRIIKHYECGTSISNASDAPEVRRRFPAQKDRWLSRCLNLCILYISMLCAIECLLKHGVLMFENRVESEKQLTRRCLLFLSW